VPYRCISNPQYMVLIFGQKCVNNLPKVNWLAFRHVTFQLPTLILQKKSSEYNIFAGHWLESVRNCCFCPRCFYVYIFHLQFLRFFVTLLFCSTVCSFYCNVTWNVKLRMTWQQSFFVVCKFALGCMYRWQICRRVFSLCGFCYVKDFYCYCCCCCELVIFARVVNAVREWSESAKIGASGSGCGRKRLISHRVYKAQIPLGPVSP